MRSDGVKMRIQKSQLVLGVVATLLLIIVWMMFAGFSASSGRPTGITYAWLTCKCFSTIAVHSAQENHSVFDVSELDPYAKSDLLTLAQSWHNGADFFIKTHFAIHAPTRELVIVSNWKLDTTKPSIWNFFSKNPAYAAGYSDGTIGLISPTEFSNLNLDGFVSVVSLITNSQLNVLRN
jgi:hypothetical protein